MKNEREGGFGAVAFICGLVIMVVISFALLQLYDANKQASRDKKVETPAAHDAGYLTVKEWGIKFKLTDGLVGVKYVVGTQKASGKLVAAFSTEALSAYGTVCAADPDGRSPLGIVVRTTSAEGSSGVTNQTTKHIGDYFYSYETPQTVCSDNSNANTLQTASLTLFKQSITSLEATK